MIRSGTRSFVVLSAASPVPDDRDVDVAGSVEGVLDERRHVWLVFDHQDLTADPRDAAVEPDVA